MGFIVSNNAKFFLGIEALQFLSVNIEIFVKPRFIFVPSWIYPKVSGKWQNKQ